MKNRILPTAVVLLFAGIAMTSCSKEKLDEIAKQHSRDSSARSSGSSSSDDSATSSEYGPCSNHDDNSGSGSGN